MDHLEFPNARLQGTCGICESSSRRIFEATLLHKYQVGYYQCTACGFMQTEAPYWLAEAYDSAITYMDIGLLDRNLYVRPVLHAIIQLFFDTKGSFIDYGGGYGILVRLMRDAGFDFYRQDTFCENLFAKGFDAAEVTKGSGTFELLTAFEVFEHLADPVGEVEKMLKYSDSIFFTTLLQPHAEVTPQNWWYFTPETGQHLSLYSRQSLQRLAERFSLNYYTNNVNFHLFTRKKIAPTLFRLVTYRKMAAVVALLSGQASLTPADLAYVKEQKGEAPAKNRLKK